jgi:hypothetical protein
MLSIERKILNDDEVVISLYNCSFIDGDYFTFLGEKVNEKVTLFAEECFAEVVADLAEDPIFAYCEGNVTVNDYISYILFSTQESGNIFHPGYDINYFKELAMQDILKDVFFPELQGLNLELEYLGKKFSKKVNVVGIYTNEDFQGFSDVSTILYISKNNFNQITGLFHFNNYERLLTLQARKWMAQDMILKTGLLPILMKLIKP